VRQRQPVRRHFDVAEQKEIDVDRPGAVAGAVEVPATLSLDSLAEVEQCLGLESGTDPDRAVQEVGLVEDLPNRLGLVERGGSLDDDTMLAQTLNRPAQLRLTIADVRAQAEVADPLLQTPSSSSASRSSDFSRVTSTPASCTT
jgi:hypothetical protein